MADKPSSFVPPVSRESNEVYIFDSSDTQRVDLRRLKMTHLQPKSEVGYGDGGSPVGGFLYPPPTSSDMARGYVAPPPGMQYWMPGAPPGGNSSNSSSSSSSSHHPVYGIAFQVHSANVLPNMGHFGPGPGVGGGNYGYGGFGGDSYGNGSGGGRGGGRGGGGNYNGNNRGKGKGQRGRGGGLDSPHYRHGVGDLNGVHSSPNVGSSGGKGKGLSGSSNNNKGRKKGSNGGKGSGQGPGLIGGRGNPSFGRPINVSNNHPHTSFVSNFGDLGPPSRWSGSSSSNGGGSSASGSFDGLHTHSQAAYGSSYPVDSQGRRYDSHPHHQQYHPHPHPHHLLAPPRAPLPAEDLVRKLKASRSKVERQKLLAEAEGYGPEARELLTPHAYTVIIATAGRDNGWRDALKWLELVRTHGAVPLDVFHFSAAIAACAKGRQWAHALFLLESMAKHGVEPDCVCFNGAISACARGGHWERALGLLGAMQRAGRQPNLISYSAAISACAKGGSWARALSLLVEMRAAGHEPNVISYSAAMSACDKGGQWAKALALLREMLHLGLAADVVSYNAALSACASGRQWAAALSVLQHMRHEGVAPNVVSFNAVLSACQRSGQWERALMLLDEMRQSGVWPDAGTFHLAIAACAEGSQGRRAFALLHALPRATGTPPDGEAYSSALVANAKEGNLHAALQIWQIMLVSNTASSSSSGGGGGGASKANGNGNSGSGNGSNGSSLAQQSPSSLTMEPTLECCGALLNLCAARAQWQPALMVIAHLENSGRIPEASMYEAAAVACERAGQASQAAALQRRAQQHQEDAQREAAANAATNAAGSVEDAASPGAGSAAVGASKGLSFPGSTASPQEIAPGADPVVLTSSSLPLPSLQLPWAATDNNVKASDATSSSFSSTWTNPSSAAAATSPSASVELPMAPSAIGQHVSPWTVEATQHQQPPSTSSSLLGVSPSSPLGLNLGDGFQSWKSFTSEGGSSFDSGSNDAGSGGDGGGNTGHQLSFLRGLSSNSGSGGGSSSNGLDDVSSCGSNSGSSQELKGSHLYGGGGGGGGMSAGGGGAGGTVSGFSSPDAESPDGLWGLLDDGEELDWRVKPQEAFDAGATLPFGDWRNAVAAGALHATPSTPSSSGESDFAAPVHSGTNAYAPLPLSQLPTLGNAHNIDLARSASATSVDSESFQPISLLPHSVVQSLGRSTSNGSTGSGSIFQSSTSNPLNRSTSNGSNPNNKDNDGPTEPIGWSTPAQLSSNSSASSSSLPKPLGLSPLSAEEVEKPTAEVEKPPLASAIGAGLSSDLSGAGELTNYLAALVVTDSANR